MFYQWIDGEMERASTNAFMRPSGWILDSSMLVVVSTALNYFHENRPQAMTILYPNGRTSKNIRQQHFELVLTLCNRGLHDCRLPDDRSQLAAILECLHGYLDLLLTHPEVLQRECFQCSGLRVVYTEKIVCKDLSGAIDDIQKLWNEKKTDQTYCWDICGPYNLRARFFKIAYKLPIFEDNTGDIAEVILRRASMVQGDDKSSALRYFQDFVPALDCETIDRLLILMPMDCQRYLINGLKKSQAAELRYCITKKFLTLCNDIQEIDEWRGNVSVFLAPDSPFCYYLSAFSSIFARICRS